MVTTPKAMCDMPKQCQLLSLVLLLDSWNIMGRMPTPFPPWSLNAHHIVFLHLCIDICPMPDNLNKCCVLATSGFK